AVSAGVTAGWGQFDTERRLAFGGTPELAEGEQDVTALGARLRAAYTVGFEAAYLRPALDLDVIHVDAGGYAERGAGALDLAVSGSDETAFVATPSVEGGAVFDIAEGLALRAYARAGASFSTVDSFAAEARFAGAPAGTGSFASAVAVADTVGRVSAGLRLMSETWMDVDLRYDGAFAGDFTEHAARLNIAVRF
ncbi:autotransporter outer membrane beta-barrel domain-containing protein, partial [Paralimibaculum aggregatum]|uniref:autotransporter outer membrane beta-barrel domain-containing protein n=1 Tax=Paralimibaculum aggregatum TaxID=3036245 RepID=UPI0025568274